MSKLTFLAKISGKNPAELIAAVLLLFFAFFFAVREQAKDISKSFLYNGIALVSIVLLVFLRPSTSAVASIPGDVLLITGLLIQFLALAFLNRSLGVVAALRTIRTAGPYRLVRHPMTTGYLTMIIGYTLLNTSPWNSFLTALIAFLVIVRISEEEAFLEKDPEYRRYKENIRYRLVPFIY